jgi:myo-inositol 2-dehydrogenase / D-chiro-inositol 1-dehydrogenase
VSNAAFSDNVGMPGAVSRRGFMAGTIAGAASLALATSALAQATAAIPQRKVKVGLVGCGARGELVGKLFNAHGGFEVTAVADYFPHVATAGGEALGVDKSRRFSGLSGYKKLIDSGVEAVVLENIPYFMPTQAAAATDAGCHVYIAKPIAVDVPGCLQIEASGALATKKGRCFFVDYQMPNDPVNAEIGRRIKAGALGQIAHVQTSLLGVGSEDPPKTETLESRFQKLIWVNDISLGCDYIGNSDIHAVDTALWILEQRPIAAAGCSRLARPNANGDARGVCSVVFDYADGLVHNHMGQAIPNLANGELTCRVLGTIANASITYSGKSFLRGGPMQYSGEVVNLYHDGIVRNIATFHDNIVNEHFDNPTVRRGVDGTLTCILGREAAARRVRMTMDELLKENKRLDVDITGLMA